MPLATTRTTTSSGRGSQSSTVSMAHGPDFWLTMAALICIFSTLILARRLHVSEHRGGRPAIDLQAVLLLIGAERGARQHPGLAVDLVMIVAARGEDFLHAVEIAGRQLRDLAPWRLERARVEDAVAQVTDKQHVEIGEIVLLDREIIGGRQKRRTIKPGGLYQRRVRSAILRQNLFAISRKVAAFEPLADRKLVVRNSNRAIDIGRRMHFVGPRQAALPAFADKLLGS